MQWPLKESEAGPEPVAHSILLDLICNTKAKLAETAGRHHFPVQPGRQRCSPLVWTQSNLFRQPGPNVSICTAKKCQRTKKYQGNLSSALPTQSQLDRILHWQCAAEWTARLAWNRLEWTSPACRFKHYRRGGKRWQAVQSLQKCPLLFSWSV